MLITLLIHELKSKFRARLWERGLVISILLGFLALYFLLVAIGLGVLLPKIMEEIHPELPVLQAVNKYLVYYFVADLSMRFFLQSYPLMAIQPYLVMPISRKKLYHFLMIRSIPEFFNIFPLFIIIPFAIVGVFPNYPPSVAWTWLILIITLMLINHYLGFYLKRSVNVKPGLTLGVLGAVALFYLVDSQGWIPISESYAYLVESVSNSPILLLVPISILVGLYIFMVNRLRKYAYLDSLNINRKRAVSTQQFDILNRFGRIGEMIQLDLKLIWRNKRPKTMVTMAVFFIMYPLIFDGEILNSLGFMIFLGVFVTGIAMTNYGQFMLGWESSFFDLLMSRNWSIRDYYEAKFYLFLVANLFMLLIGSVYGFMNIYFPLVFLAAALFNVGVNSFVLMFFSTFNNKRIDLGKQAFFNYEGVSATQFLIVLPIFLVPFVIYWPFVWLGYKWWGLAAIGLVGLMGILLRPFLLDFIVKQFELRKHRIVSGFREK